MPVSICFSCSRFCSYRSLMRGRYITTTHITTIPDFCTHSPNSRSQQHCHFSRLNSHSHSPVTYTPTALHLCILHIITSYVCLFARPDFYALAMLYVHTFYDSRLTRMLLRS
ncbi:hypothetical protein K503DRAFT_773738 [Rhizopogon vinicolor AM-OR11-026]|uniref:Uncharacterized protein n=1 Tax=Rhizopogon vinicolor AM-OR11-026 TaxID=1314800 RepID=A0A1B7MRE2_9AGAM|nr:hypothetical protein K503DRAFT_773738 [Rhizopogon vinicolor AM-OR11-026]